MKYTPGTKIKVSGNEDDFIEIELGEFKEKLNNKKAVIIKEGTAYDMFSYHVRFENGECWWITKHMIKKLAKKINEL